MDNIDKYSLILFEIIKRNCGHRKWRNRGGGSRRWPDLYAVDFFSDWMDGDFAYIYCADNYDNPKYKGYEYSDSSTPSYWCFYLNCMEVEERIKIEERDEKGIDLWSSLCIAFETYKNVSGKIELMAMPYPYFFDYYSNSEGDAAYVLEKRLTSIIESISPELSSFKIEDTQVCEKKVCRLLDILEDYTLIYKLDNYGSEFLYHLPSDDVLIEELLDNLWRGYDALVGDYYIHSIEVPEEKWNSYDFQRLCLLYAYKAIEEDSEWLLFQIKEIIIKEQIALDDFTIWFLKENEKSFNDKESRQRLNELFELSQAMESAPGEIS